jgi:hypothetical protein
MSHALHIAEAAGDGIREAFLWYEDQKAGLGSGFEKHISKAFESLMLNPFKKQLRYGALRAFCMNQSPCEIPYYKNISHVFWRSEINKKSKQNLEIVILKDNFVT